MPCRPLYMALSLLCALLVAAPASAEPAPVELPRAARWQMDFGENVCRLIGAFGQGDDAIFVRFARFAPTDGFELSLYGKPLHSNDAFREIGLSFGPGGTMVKTRANTGSLAGLPMLVTNARLDNLEAGTSTSPAAPPAAVTPDQEAAVGALDIRLHSFKTYRLMLGSMRAPMRLMRECTDAMMAHWGHDPQQYHALRNTPQPVGSKAMWLMPDDYPKAALERGGMAIIHFRLDVGTRGEVTGCHVQEATQSGNFDELTCQLLSRRARLTPAINAAGQPVASFYVDTVRWLL